MTKIAKQSVLMTKRWYVQFSWSSPHLLQSPWQIPFWINAMQNIHLPMWRYCILSQCVTLPRVYPVLPDYSFFSPFFCTQWDSTLSFSLNCFLIKKKNKNNNNNNNKRRLQPGSSVLTLDTEHFCWKKGKKMKIHKKVIQGTKIGTSGRTTGEKLLFQNGLSYKGPTM